MPGASVTLQAIVGDLQDILIVYQIVLFLAWLFPVVALFSIGGQLKKIGQAHLLQAKSLEKLATAALGQAEAMSRLADAQAAMARAYEAAAQGSLGETGQGKV